MLKVIVPCFGGVLIGWSQDGRQLVIHSDRDGQPDLHTVPVRDVPIPRLRPGGPSSIDVNRDGKILFDAPTFSTLELWAMDDMAMRVSAPRSDRR